MITIGDPRRHDISAAQRERFETARKGAAAGTKLFGGTADETGTRLDFNTPSTRRVKSSGMASTMDLYAPTVRDEDAARDDLARRKSALPAHIADLSTKFGLAVDALEVLSLVEQRSKAMGGSPVPVQRGEVARAVGTTPDRAEEIIGTLERRNFIRRQAISGTIAYYTASL